LIPHQAFKSGAFVADYGLLRIHVRPFVSTLTEDETTAIASRGLQQTEQVSGNERDKDHVVLCVLDYGLTPALLYECSAHDLSFD
jgi:hypothetical protein